MSQFINEILPLNVTELKKWVHYDPITGIFIRLIHRERRYVGAPTGCTGNKNGYVTIKLKGKFYLAHRLAWLYMTGSWPSTIIDHEDRDTSNNAWLNLRLATINENNYNAKISCTNKSGYRGVSWDASRKMWRAQCYINKKLHYLGCYLDIKDAVRVRNDFAITHHGNFYVDLSHTGI